MSRAQAAVRFPDGTVKFAIYDGTSDVLYPGLFNTHEDAWDAYSASRARKERADADPLWPKRPDFISADEIEDVVVYQDYGGGGWWEAKATREFVICPLETFDHGEMLPCQWHTERIEEHRGRPDPDWVPWEDYWAEVG